MLNGTRPKPYIKEQISMIKLRPEAEYPKKQDVDSCCYSLDMAYRTESRAEDTIGDVNEFGTGIAFKVPLGYYLEITPNPSLAKCGYQFTGPHLVDYTDNDEVILSLIKFKDCPDIELPFDAVYFTIREEVKVHFAAVTRQAAHDLYDEYEQEIAPVRVPMGKKPVTSVLKKEPPKKKGAQPFF